MLLPEIKGRFFKVNIKGQLRQGEYQGLIKVKIKVKVKVKVKSSTGQERSIPE